MKYYKTKVQYVEAQEIDSQWIKLLEERGYKDVNLGDFLIVDKNGFETIWPRKGFLTLYEDV